MELVHVGRTYVAHSGADTAHHLVYDARERALVRHHPLDAFGNELVLSRALLEVSVLAAAALHCAERSHSPVALKGTAPVYDGFAGAFLGSGKERAYHDDVGAGGKGFDYIAGVPYASVRDRHSAPLVDCVRNAHNSCHLGNPDAGHYPCRTYRARTDADLNCVHTRIHKGLSRFGGSYVPRDQRKVTVFFSQFGNHVEHCFGMSVRRVYYDDVYTCRYECLSPVKGIRTDS